MGFIKLREYSIINLINREKDSYFAFNEDFPDGSVGEESTSNAGDTGDAGLIPGLGRCAREGNGDPLPYSCLENPMDRGAWQAIIHGVAKEIEAEGKSPSLAMVSGNKVSQP